MSLSDAQLQLLEQVKRNLFEKSADRGRLTEAVIKEAKEQAVLGVIAKDINVVAKNMQVNAQHAALEDVLTVPYVTLKGYSSAFYYKMPIYRQMGDVDFLVAPEDYQKAKRELTANGYQQTDSGNPCHDGFKKDGIRIELHYKIHGMPNEESGIKCNNREKEAATQKYLGNIIADAQKVSTNFGTIRIPSKFHHGIVMLLHVAGHMVNGGGIGLRHLCDWAVYANRINLSDYEKAYEEMGLWRFAQILSCTSVKYLGLPYESWMGEIDDALTGQLIEDIMCGGNFGRKEKNRAISNELSKKSFFKTLIDHAEHAYPFGKRHPMLLPAAVGMFAVRHSYRMMTGRKTIISKEQLEQANKRQTMYEALKLFV